MSEPSVGRAFCDDHIGSLTTDEKKRYNLSGQRRRPDHAYETLPLVPPAPTERITHIGLSLTDEDIMALGYMSGMVPKDVEMKPRIAAVATKIHLAIMRAQDGKI